MTKGVARQFATSQIPKLDQLVPSTGDDDRVVVLWGGANTDFCMTLILDSVLADAQSIP